MLLLALYVYPRLAIYYKLTEICPMCSEDHQFLPYFS